jgi:hypothetical protein
MKRFLKIGNRGIVDRDEVVAVSRYESCITVSEGMPAQLRYFYFDNPGDAQRALDIVIAELTGEKLTPMCAPSRYFRDDRRVYVVPSDGSDAGRSFYLTTRRWGGCTWSLEDILGDYGVSEITETEFRQHGATLPPPPLATSSRRA